MKRGQNAFTLVELLAVIVILAIILIIVVPGVLSIINKTKDNAYDRQVDMIKKAAKNYVTANTVTWSGENPKSTVVTLDMLQTGGYLDKKIVDPRDKKEILCANVLVSKDNKNKITYDVDMTCNDVQPITPRVGSGMIPIVYDGTNWRKADVSNKNFAWFNYGNQQWANVATVTEDIRQTLLDAPVDTILPMDKINTMFTWIPRFKYKLFNVDGTVSPVGNVNMAGDYMIDIKFETASTTKSTGTKNGQWLTHPAFTFGGQELEGFWMAKFETGYKDATTTVEAQVNTLDPFKVIVKPSVYSWRSIQIINMYKNAQGMKDASNPYGFTANEDPHLAKNMEWGAMAYLTQSKYGKQGNAAYVGAENQVRINNNNKYLTGCGADAQNAAEVATCNSYETVHGVTASTTGNISGIYDTSGGAWDYVAGVMKAANGTDLSISSSGFDQTGLNQIGTEGKYLDVYEYSTNWQDRSRGHLGDATLEMGPFNINSDRGAWYEDYAVFVTDSYSWFGRGIDWYNGVITGPLAFGRSGGGVGSTYGSRIVLV